MGAYAFGSENFGQEAAREDGHIAKTHLVALRSSEYQSHGHLSVDDQ